MDKKTLKITIHNQTFWCKIKKIKMMIKINNLMIVIYPNYYQSHSEIV